MPGHPVTPHPDAPAATAAVSWFTALAVAAASFVLYRSTMLPGVDLGDTPSFQVMGGSTMIGPRDGYPLYFAVSAPFVWWSGGDPAHALNLASAVAAALASGLLVVLATHVSGSLRAGACAAMLFAGSYTFWSQAVIAEVYALHIVMVVLTLLTLLAWARRPDLRHLALCFAVYALGFGNHLAMILLAPGMVLFLLLSAPAGWRSLLAPRVLMMAVAAATLGALQYAVNVRTLLADPVPPRTLYETLLVFWFDVTKADWRDTMVGRVPGVMADDRLQMYLFDLHQQFGGLGLCLAAVGIVALAAKGGRRAGLLLTTFVVTVLFALTYNVGDTHVFLLPSHLIVALAIAAGLAAAAGWARVTHRHGGAVVYALSAAMIAARLWSDYPALDRSGDRRPEDALARLTAGLDDRRDVLLTDVNWQMQNGLTYFTTRSRPGVAMTPLSEVVLYAPTLIRDNLAIGRDVALTERAQATLSAAYGPLFTPRRDARVEPQRLGDLVADLAPGTRYVLCLLKPSPEYPLDSRELDGALAQLTGQSLRSIAVDRYAAVAGRAGMPPDLVVAATRPFRKQVTLDGVDVDVRMESWLDFDTIRRMGFGQVVAARHHTLIVERGVSFAAFDERGQAIRMGYAASLFAPEARYVIPAVR
jgi:hypothetical protein